MDVGKSRHQRWGFLAITLLFGVPAAALQLSGAEVDALLSVFIFGIGILAGAFLLSWAAEVAELDISAALAIAILALLTILPEYAIETVLAWDASASFNPETGEVTAATRRVAANVTGANRLLIGVGWSIIILVYWVKHRDKLDLRGHLDRDFPILTIATVITFAIFFLQGVSVLLAVVRIGLY